MKNERGPQREMERRLPARAYVVSAEADTTVLYAINVYEQNGYLNWFDGTKERIMKIISSEKEGDCEEYVMKSGERYRFEPMTLELYREKVKDRLAGKLEFKSEEELFQALEDAMRHAW